MQEITLFRIYQLLPVYVIASMRFCTDSNTQWESMPLLKTIVLYIKQLSAEQKVNGMEKLQTISLDVGASIYLDCCL